MGKHLVINYFCTQAYSGHGKCAEYLKRFKLIYNDVCRDCNKEVDSMEHTLFNCVSFSEKRKSYGITKKFELLTKLDREELERWAKYVGELMMMEKNEMN